MDTKKSSTPTIFKKRIAPVSLVCNKYRITLRDNPSNSIVIGWNQVSGENPVVYYDTIDNGQVPGDYAFKAVPNREVKFAEMDNRFVRLNNLSPDTDYFFIIKDNESMSERYWFRTAPYGPDARYSFIAGGDSRNNPVPRRNANLLVSKLKPHAVLFGCHMTVRGTPEQWIAWLDDWQLTISEEGRMFPVIAARGNHEPNNEMVYNLFDVPSEDIYFAITIGDQLLRTYTLNTEISISGEQTRWLKIVVTLSSPVAAPITDYCFNVGLDSIQIAAGDGVAWDWSSGDTTQSIYISTGNLYNVTVTDAYGCSNDGSIYIHYNHLIYICDIFTFQK